MLEIALKDVLRWMDRNQQYQKLGMNAFSFENQSENQSITDFVFLH